MRSWGNEPDLRPARCHPDCEVLLERHSVDHLYASAAEAAEEPPRPLEERTRERLDRFLAACEASAANSSASKWGHKTTTEHIFALYEPYADDMTGFSVEQYFVDRCRHVPTIFITRDGRTCVPSKMKRAGLPLDLAISRWRYSIYLLGAFQKFHPNFLHLRFEDLVQQPESTLARVCAFRGIAYSDEMLRGTKNTKLLPEYQSEIVDPSKAQIGAEPSWAPMIAAELRAAGYQGLADASISGHLEALSSSRAAGWALAGNAALLAVSVVVDGRLIASGEVNLHRPDVAEAFGTNGRNGFDLVLPNLSQPELRRARVVVEANGAALELDKSGIQEIV